jgi:uncharacterized protein (DUF2147 family)
MSKLDTKPLPIVSGNRARVLAAVLCCVFATLMSRQAVAADAAGMDEAADAPAAAEFVPLHTRPAALAKTDIRRHVPGALRTGALPTADIAQSDSAGLYRQVSRNFKFGLRYTRAVFSLAPAESAADDHYVFLNLVGML